MMMAVNHEKTKSDKEIGLRLRLRLRLVEYTANRMLNARGMRREERERGR
jgi:hypothetical protein